MLGKLIKHEFKAVSKILGILHIALAFTTIMGMIAISLTKDNRFEFIGELTLVLYILILIAVAVAVLIYIIVRFYRNLFKDEGYLMNTLPVKSYELIVSKLVVSFIWLIINGVCTAFSILLLVLSQTSFVDLLEFYNQMATSLYTQTGISISFLVILVIFGGIISILYMLTMFYAAIAIGQTMRKHKVLFSLGAYFVLYTISQIISTIGLMPFGFISFINEDTTAFWSTSFTLMIILSYLVSAGLGIVYFIITNYIISKKLNLD